MNFKGFVYIISILCCLNVGYAEARQFSAGLGDANWEVTLNRLECRMQQTIPKYGAALFRHKSASVPFFELQSWQNAPRGVAVALYAKKPIWKRAGRKQLLGKAALRGGKKPLHLNVELTEKMLATLDKGTATQIEYPSEIGNKINIQLSVENFQAAYAKYTQCVGDLLPFTFDDVEVSTVHFNTNSYFISKFSRRQLNKIKEYVLADPKVKSVRINGYSDNAGRKGHNMYLSELRAIAVKKHLIESGVPKEKIKVYWHGVKKPVTTNNTEQGRVANRRATIQIVRY